MKKVLVIDDASDVLENIEELLALSGYEVLTASDGREGLEVARSTKPDIILCDVMMPKLDGLGVLRAIRNIPELAGTPFVFLTARAERQDFRAGMDLGADDYLTKPFSGDELLRVLQTRSVKKQPPFNPGEARTLTESDLAAIAQKLSTRAAKQIRKGETVFMEGDTSNYIYYVISGKIKISKMNEFGKEFIVALNQSGDLLGYETIIDSETHRHTATAVEDSELSLIPRQDFLQLIATNRDVFAYVLQYLNRSMAEAEEKLLQVAYNSARKRVADALLFVYRKYSGGLDPTGGFRVNRENLSALAGISPESVSRNLSDFKDEGLIEVENGVYRILDIQKLERLKN